MNFFKLYIGDYQRDTAHLSVAENGAYLMMLQYLYATEKPLPKGAALYRMLRAVEESEREAIDSVVAQFWTETDEGLINERALEEIRKSEHQRTVNREQGKRGGRPKKTEQQTEHKTDSVSENKPTNNPNHSQTPDNSPSLRSGENARASRLPADWRLPDEWREWAQTERPDLDVNETADRFRDYWVAIPGAKGRKLDWAATWRNWIRNESGGKHENGSRTSQAGRGNSVIASIARGALDSG